MSSPRAAPPQGSSPTEGLTGRTEEAEGVNPGVQPRPEGEVTSHCTVFTYFKGDIDTVVDEHFTRALKRAGAQAGGGGKRRTESIGGRAGEKVPSVPWSQSSLWPSPYLGAHPAPSALSIGAGAMRPAPYHPESLQTLRAGPCDPWLLPRGSGQSVGSVINHPPLLQVRPLLPADPQRQYSSLLVTLPGQRPIHSPQAPGPKTSAPAPWTAIPPRESDAQQMNPESGRGADRWRSEEGFHCQEKQKDIYWY